MDDLTSVQSLSMPNLAQGFANFRHTIDSALETLGRLGIPSSRITIRMVGRGVPARWIELQSPNPGTILTPNQTVTLSVAGLAFSQNLPVGMWDRGGASEPGTAELLEALDDPLSKANHWIREGALLFDIAEDNLPACSRWLSLFGLTPDSWPTQQWYRLSILLPNIQALAGTEAGIRFALSQVLDVPLQEISTRPGSRRFKQSELSRLGDQHSRAGIDYIVGDRFEDLSQLMLVLGPVPLDTYYHHQRPQLAKQLRELLLLVLPTFRTYSVRWAVLDKSQAPKLGIRSKNSILGINTHLGPLTPSANFDRKCA